MMNSNNYGFASNPICELCNKKDAVAFSIIRGAWVWTCFCVDDDEEYYIYIEDFYSSATVNVKWICHLALHKDMNWKGFGEMMVRLRGAIGKPGKRKLKNKIKESISEY